MEWSNIENGENGLSVRQKLNSALGYLCEKIDEKQDILSEGANVTIEDNVISAEIEGVNKEVIEAMQNQIMALSLGVKLSMAVSPTVVEKNVSATYTLSATFANAMADKISILDGDTVLKETSSAGSLSFAETKTLASDKSYSAKASYNGLNFIANVTVLARNRVLYGFCDADKNPVKKLSARTSALTTYEDTTTLSNQKFKILVPTDVTAPTKFSMGGAPAVFDMTTVTIGDITYKCFTSGGVYTKTTLTIKAE